MTMETTDTALHEDTIGIGSLSLHFASWGRRTTPERAIILVHGLTASSREFVEIGPALAARGWYVIAPDLRGRGRSAKPAHGYAVPCHASDILSLCDHLGLTCVRLVGHSLGAIISMYLAAIYPERVEKVVMIDFGGVVPDDTQQAIAASVNRLGTAYPSLDAYLDQMRQLPMFQWNALWEGYFRYDAEVHPDGTVSSCVPRKAIQEELAALDALRIEHLPPLVRQPTLLLRAGVGLLGADKGFLLTREVAEHMRANMTDCQLVEIPDANHYTIIEAPDLLDAVVAFATAE